MPDKGLSLDISMRNIPSEPGKSRSEDIFHAWAKHEIGDEDYYNHTAIVISESSELYRPRPIKQPHPNLIGYAQDRICGRAEYDYATAYSIGIWFAATIAIISENAKDLEVLSWARDKLIAIGLSAPAETVAGFARRYELVLPPAREIEFTIQCKKLDAMARERKRA